MESNSRVAKISLVLAGIGAAAFAAGPAAAQLELASPFVAFRILLLGVLLGLLALILGSIGVWRTRPAAGRRGRGSALAGMGLGGLLVGIIAVAAGSSGGAPMINDITTDPDDPPVFRAAQEEVANAGRDLRYPGDAFAREQRRGYPDLAPIHVKGTRAAVYRRCVTAAQGLGWKLTREDPEDGTFEATDVTRLFRFVDDIVVRVRPARDGSIVDVRSKSRDGRGDMGANAARIRAFRDALGG